MSHKKIAGYYYIKVNVSLYRSLSLVMPSSGFTQEFSEQNNCDARGCEQ